MSLEPPVAPQRPTIRTHHGDTVIDNYEWLRDKQSPDVIAHLEAENAYTDQATAHLAPLEKTIYDEIVAATVESDVSVPTREGDWWYYSRTVEGQQYAIRCRVAATDGWVPPELPADGGGLPGEEVLLDGNLEASGHDFFSLGSFDVSTDGTRLLWAVDTVGDERYTIRVRSLTGERFADEIPDTSAGALFDPSGRYIFYATVDEAWRPDTVWRHQVGSGADDVQVFTEPDERFWLDVSLTRSRRFLVIELGSKITGETWLLDATNPTGEFDVVWPRETGVEYSVEDDGSRLLITHNRGAEDFEVVACDTAGNVLETVLPHTPGTRIDGVDAFAGHLVVSYRREGLSRVSVDLVELEFDETVYSVGVRGNPSWEQPAVRLSYTSLVTPATTLSHAFDGTRTVLKQQVVNGYDPELYSQERVWAPASDGTMIPVSLVYRADLVDGPAPVHLYGYGSYEASMDPYFSIPRLSMLDRGVVFAIAHVRGGGEMGRAWYENGKTLTKKNTFTDFVDVARYLHGTRASSIVAEGGSAGGLLMGAIANLAPSLFSGVLAAVPFVDPLTSILDPDLPLTVVEWDEWGDPLHDPEVYAYMKSYSPYENVRTDVAYPPILAVTSLNDTRVLYVEPAKWVARLREVGAPVLMRCEMSAGHGGVSGRYESWRKRAFEMAWMLSVLEI